MEEIYMWDWLTVGSSGSVTKIICVTKFISNEVPHVTKFAHNKVYGQILYITFFIPKKVYVTFLYVTKFIRKKF
jgi:hypothetical protein